MSWWKRDKPSLNPEEGHKHVRTEGLWIKCEGCSQIIWRKAMEEGVQLCPKCGYHFRIDAETRCRLLFDNAEYVADAASLGIAKGYITLGHVISEQPGMEDLAKWMQTFVDGIPIRFVPAEEPFWT